MIAVLRRFTDTLARVFHAPGDIDIAQRQFDAIFGGSFDPYAMPPPQVSGYLKNPVDEFDREAYAAAGVVQDKRGWRLPEAKWNDHALIKDLRPWWLRTPADLVNHQELNKLTVTGESVDAYVHTEDYAKGPDSTALPLVYTSIPVATAAALVVWNIIGHLAPVGPHALWSVLGAVLCLIPVAVVGASLVALEEMFGAWAAIKAAFFGVVLPVVGVGVSLGTSASLLAMWGNGVTLKIVALVGIVILVVVVVTAVMGRRRGGLGTIGARLRRIMWWTVAYAILALVIGLLPSAFHGSLFFVPACLMALMHQDTAWIARAEDLAVQGYLSNRSKNLPFFNKNWGPNIARNEQVLRAALDTTPFFNLGRSTGAVYQATKSPLAPLAAGILMGLSRADLQTHLIVFGGTGTGKTFSVARPLLEQYALKPFCEERNLGALVLDGKGGQLVDDMRSCIDIVLEPGSDWAPWQGMDAIQLGFILENIRPDGMAVKLEEGVDSYWRNGAQLYNSHMAAIHGALFRHELTVRAAQRQHVARRLIQSLILDIEAMQPAHNAEQVARRQENALEEIRELTNKLRLHRQWRWNAAECWKSVQEANQVIVQSTGNEVGKAVRLWKKYLGFVTDDDQRAVLHPDTIYPEVHVPNSSLSESFAFLDQWAALPDQTRGSLFGNVTMIWAPLMKTATEMANAAGVPWVALEQGTVSAAMALRGKIVGVALNVATYGPAARIMIQVAKSRVYSGLRRRIGNWMAQGETPVQFLYDEAHLLIGKDEVDLITVARSLGGMFTFLTQGIHQFRGVAGFSEQELFALIGECKSLVCFKTDPETYAYIESRLGVTQTYFELARQSYTNVAAAIARVYDTNLPNRDHPMAAHYQQMERGGYGEISIHNHNAKQINQGTGHHLVHSDATHMMNAIKGMDPVASIAAADQNGNPLMVPYVSANSLSSKLLSSGTGYGLLAVQRAGVMRIDFCQFDGLAAAPSHTKEAA